jgi:hypothetical protein
MPVEEETVGGTRVVPTTQTRTQRGQDTSDRLHQTEKYIITKVRNKIGDKVIETLTEVKMSVIRREQWRPTRRRRIRVRTESLCWVWSVKKCQIEWCLLDRKRRTDERDRKYLALLRMIQPTRRTWNPPDDEGFQDERDICQGDYTRE